MKNKYGESDFWLTNATMDEKILPSRMIILMLLENKLITTKSKNPTSTGERASDNADNLWSPILSYYWNLIQLGVTNKSTDTTPESEPLSMKSIQILVLPIKPDGYLDHHQVGTWTQKCTRWNWTTEIIISPSFEFQDEV